MDPIEIPAPTTISKASRGFSLAGFTLIEILIVLAIISMVMSVGLPAIDRVTYQQVNSTTRRFVGLMRTVRNDAILLNHVYRLALDLDEKTWWVESQKSFQLLSEPAPPVKKGGKQVDPPPSNFEPATKYSKKPVKLPNGVALTAVLKDKEGLIKSGMAYIHFFPSGFNEQAIIYLTKEGSAQVAYSIVVRPTSGRMEIKNSEIKSFDL